MRKLAVLFVVMCACGPDAGTHEDAGVDGHPMADAMVDAPPQCVGLDDGIDCTVDTCDMATGQVTHTPTNAMCSMPAPRASSSAYCTTGRSTTVSISLGMALVAGKKRVPSPATGKTAFVTALTLLVFLLIASSPSLPQSPTV